MQQNVFMRTKHFEQYKQWNMRRYHIFYHTGDKSGGTLRLCPTILMDWSYFFIWEKRNCIPVHTTKISIVANILYLKERQIRPMVTIISVWCPYVTNIHEPSYACHGTGNYPHICLKNMLLLSFLHITYSNNTVPSLIQYLLTNLTVITDE